MYLNHIFEHVSLTVQVRWWDVTVGKQDFRLEGHTDYVRSAAVSPGSQDTWATAGYDHICKLWDVRSQECVMNLDHGAPIEDVAFFPSGTYSLSSPLPDVSLVYVTELQTQSQVVRRQKSALRYRIWCSGTSNMLICIMRMPPSSPVL